MKIELFTPVSRAVKRLGSKLILALVLSCATLLVGFYLGRHTADKEVQVSPEAFRVAQSQLSDMRDALDVTLGELQVQRTRHEVDSRALELVRSEMAAEKVRTAELEEGLVLYRSMGVSDDPVKGIPGPRLVGSDVKRFPLDAVRLQ